MTDETKVYAVSYGNGNDGVSHVFPDFYCRTDKPYELARLAIITSVIDPFHSWADSEAMIDGEADYTISATLLEGPDGETEFGAAWLIAEVFPVDDSEGELTRVANDPYGKPIYNGIEACFGADVLAAFPDKP